MNFILKPSLEHIALVKVAALLWNQQDIRALVTEFSKSPFSELERSMFSTFIRSERKKEWPMIQDQVIEKMTQLLLPIPLKEKLIGYIQSVGIQISKWMKHHLQFCYLDDLSNEFCWTSQGTVDEKKTAEVLVRNDSVNIITRYVLACVYCLEDDIPQLWNKIPESQEEFRYVIYDSMFMDDIKLIFLMNLLSLWTPGVKIDNSSTRINYGRSYQNLLRLAAESGSKAAAEYFLQKLDLKEEFLLNTALNVTKKLDYYNPETEYVKENYNEVLCFLISQMSSDQQLKLFQQCPHKVLYCLLDWPFQSLFVEAAKLLWNFLPKNNYHLVLLKIIEKEYFGYKDYNYKKVFRDVWQEIPDADKSFIINDDRTADLLDRLLRIKDKENLKLIFQSATPIEKNKFIFSDRGHYFCRNMIHHEEWDLVKFFVQLLISSKNEMVQFKLGFQEYIMKDVLVKGYWYKFSRILDDFIRGYDERNADEGESSSAKRFCNVEFKDMSHGAEK